MAHLVVQMAERMNIPIAADLLSKSAVPENHPLYLGVYGGAMSSDQHVRTTSNPPTRAHARHVHHRHEHGILHRET